MLLLPNIPTLCSVPMPHKPHSIWDHWAHRSHISNLNRCDSQFWMKNSHRHPFHRHRRQPIYQIYATFHHPKIIRRRQREAPVSILTLLIRNKKHSPAQNAAKFLTHITISRVTCPFTPVPDRSSVKYVARGSVRHQRSVVISKFMCFFLNKLIWN